MLRVLVVDDEAPARARLRQLLDAFEDVEVVGEARDGQDAVEQIAAVRPDLVFLDIQMPACSGLDVVASLPTPRPKIVFCTAYDQHAVDAFELNALDYLLKPVTRARLAQALVRARERSQAEWEASMDRAEESAGYPARFLARVGARYQIVPRREVLLFGSEGGLTVLQTAEHRYWMQPALHDLEKRLDPAVFCRVSRSAIVNLDAVREVTPDPAGHGTARLTNGLTVAVSRRRLRALMERLVQ